MSLTTLFAVVLLPVLLALIGLVADGGQILVARRQVQGLAESAAHAGAAELDVAVARANPDQPAPLGPRAAELAAAQWDYVALGGYHVLHDVAANAWPLQRRHSTQWQSSTSAAGSLVVAPAGPISPWTCTTGLPDCQPMASTLRVSATWAPAVSRLAMYSLELLPDVA